MSAVGAVEPVELAARHRMPADEARVVDGTQIERLHAADVGDGTCGLGQCPLHLIGHGQHRDGDERDLGIGVDAGGVDRPASRGRVRRRDRRCRRPTRASPGRASRARSSRRSGRARSRWHGAGRYQGSRSRRTIVLARLCGHGLDQASSLGRVEFTPRSGRQRAIATAGRSASAPAAVTGWPTASHIRRTWRLRPSWIVMRSTARRRAATPGPGRDAVVELDAVTELAERAA